MGQFGVGQSVRRTEDVKFLTGTGRFLDDINLDGQAHAVFLRSPHAHAALRSVDISAAAAAPGVVAVYTGADTKAAGLGDLPCLIPAMGMKMERLDGQPAYSPVRHLLAREHVHHVGDPIAMVVAETMAAAKDAAERIGVGFDVMPAVTGTALAIDRASPRAHADARDNLAFDTAIGDAEKTADAFAKADHIATIDLVQNRIVVNSMEARGAIGAYDPGTNRYTLICGLQTVYRIRKLIAEILGIEERQLRVVSPDVGGAFGMKGFTYPEQPLVVWAAKQLGRPVKWMGERSEAFLSDNQGRDLVTHAELALDGSGHFLGLRVNTTSTVGAYFSNFAPMIVSLGNTRMLPGVYALPAVHAQVKVAMTNTVPIDAYRGAGRPEACYAMERLADIAARDLGLTPEEIRRRNMVAPEQMPFTGPTGVTFDSGDFERNLSDCLKLADRAGFAARKDASAMAGKLRGFGVTSYVEATAAAPENSAIEFSDDGSVKVLVGSQASGQGHLTAFAQVAADNLGIPFERIEVLQGDSD
ncbi:MAG: xanthine dehydrogenase family protein, partial [Proteobacteria bacterium]|nr:xanthine dehydrogenase family protein [Pseudomonadota bacterium]